MIFCQNDLLSQININPDPNGPPWIVGGMPEITPELQAELDSIPNLLLTPASLNTLLPYMIDNSQLPYMRSIFLQQYSSCSQAAGIGYMFTYEINRARDSAANDSTKWYHPAFTYNFLNYGSADSGSIIWEGLRIIKEMGCPSIATYGKDINEVNATEWMTGYDKYLSAMKNRISSYEKIDITDSLGLDTLKHWLYDHGCGVDTGGLAVFGVLHMAGLDYDTIHGGHEAGKSIVIIVDTTSDNDAHAMTFVGYNDSIRYDFNGDGSFTNNIDINGDGIVDMQDWEWGALKVYNSWGTGTWPSYTFNGWVYLPYRFLPDTNFLNGDYAYVCHAIAEYEPELVIKSELTHPNRDKFFANFGFNSTAGNQTPEAINACWPINNGVAGEYPLLGCNNNNPLEIIFDYLYYFQDQGNHGQIFFRPQNIDPYNYTGMLLYYSLVDYRWSAEFELACDNVPDTMEYALEWKFSIDYDLLPFEITEDTIISTNQVCRLEPYITGGNTLYIGAAQGKVEIHFYDGNLVIDHNATLYLHDNTKIIGKRGDNRITVYGSLVLGENVNFKAEDDATFYIYFAKENETYCLSGAEFDKSGIKGYCQELIVDSCTFQYSIIDYGRLDLEVKNSEFNNSTITVSRPLNANSMINIHNCNFNNNFLSEKKTVITIEDYAGFLIDNNNITYSRKNGIDLYYAGRSSTSTHTIQNNTIEFSGIIQDKNKGINMYLSNVDIKNNLITNNSYGIVAFQKSNISVMGDSLAQVDESTQRIIHNIKNQCFFSFSSFPNDIRYNVITDSTSTENALIRTVNYDIYIEHPNDTIASPEHTDRYDVRLNCWRDDNDSLRLIPVGSYMIAPRWCPGDFHGKDTTEARAMYYEAKANINSQNYPAAENNLKQIIADYPGNEMAIIALKELFSLETVNNNNYNNLKLYYDSIYITQTDSTLKKTAKWLSVHCEIILENYQYAINRLDSIITTPETKADSIFAIIDLGYVFTQMNSDTNSRATLVTNYPDQIPKNICHYRVRREELIKQLLNFETTQNKQPEELITNEEKQGRIVSNTPNPFTKSTKIKYELKVPGNVKIYIYSSQGQKIKKISLGNKQKGEHEQIIQTKNWPTGLYFCSLILNEKVVDTKKMICFK